MNELSIEAYGIDSERGLRNCMGNIDFYKKILSMFLLDKSFEKAKNAYATGNVKQMFSSLHELKGVSGNTALTDLYNSCIPLVELLRNDGAPDDELSIMFSAVEKNYYRACEGIEKFIQPK